MKRFLQFSGLFLWIALVFFGLTYAIENYNLVLNSFFSVFGIVAFILAIGYLLARILWGKNLIIGGGKAFLIGNDLINAINATLEELPKPKKETLANLGGHLVYRFTRLGLITLLLAIIPVWLLWQQNNLLKQQNRRLDQQTNLQEAERRSALIFIYGNLLETIDREIRENEDKTGKRSLSPQTIGQIIALSQRLKPYRYLEDDRLILEPLSPERSQLLISLVESRLDSSTYIDIFKSATFAFADLEGVNFEGANLKYIDLRNSRLKKANLRKTNLSSSNLQGSNFDSVDLVGSNLLFANLSNASLIGAFLSYSNLRKSLLNNANLESANLHDADLRNASLVKAKLRHANLKYTDFGMDQESKDRIFGENLWRLSGAPRNDFEFLNQLLYSDTIRPGLDTFHSLSTNLQSADLSYTEVWGANFEGANLSFANLMGCDFFHVNLSGVILIEAVLENCNFHNSIINNTVFSKEDFMNTDLSGAFILIEKKEFRDNLDIPFGIFNRKLLSKFSDEYLQVYGDVDIYREFHSDFPYTFDSIPTELRIDTTYYVDSLFIPDSNLIERIDTTIINPIRVRPYSMKDFLFFQLERKIK